MSFAETMSMTLANELIVRKITVHAVAGATRTATNGSLAGAFRLDAAAHLWVCRLGADAHVGELSCYSTRSHA
jgi:hypothetical protein